MRVDDIELTWSHGRATVNPAAGMLREAHLRDGDTWVSPFASPAWLRDDPLLEPGLLRELGAEFACVPFGSAAVPPKAPPGWRSTPAQQHPHGPTANLPWTVVERSPSRVVMQLELAEPNAVARVTRVVEGVEGEPCLAFALTVQSRRDHRSSLGLHPIFRLPAVGETLDVDAQFTEGRTYPVAIEGGSHLLAVDRSFSSLGDVGGIDISRLPFAERAEEIVQLLDARSPLRLHWSNGDSVSLEWDAAVLPSVLLWIADRQLSEAPWNRTYRGLGVEPIASAFDLPPEVSAAPNPLRASGHRTAVELFASAPLELTYRVTAKHGMN